MNEYKTTIELSAELEMNEYKTTIELSAELEMCPYWDTENNRPTHTCNGCAEPDNHLNAMIDGVRYCLLDIDITGKICRENVHDTNVGNIEYIRKEDALERFYDSISGVPASSVEHVSEYANKMMRRIQNLEPADVVQTVKCGNCEHYIDSRNWCDYHMTKMFKSDFCSQGEKKKFD